jgi:hypothetical protein
MEVVLSDASIDENLDRLSFQRSTFAFPKGRMTAHNRSMKNYFLFGNVLVLLLVCATSSAHSTKSYQIQSTAKEFAGFAKGNYRLEGHCQKMEALGRDKTGACLSFMGIDASDPSFPQFIFALEGNQIPLRRRP